MHGRQLPEDPWVMARRNIVPQMHILRSLPRSFLSAWIHPFQVMFVVGWLCKDRGARKYLDDYLREINSSIVLVLYLG